MMLTWGRRGRGRRALGRRRPRAVVVVVARASPAAAPWPGAAPTRSSARRAPAAAAGTAPSRRAPARASLADHARVRLSLSRERERERERENWFEGRGRGSRRGGGWRAARAPCRQVACCARLSRGRAYPQSIFNPLNFESGRDECQSEDDRWAQTVRTVSGIPEHFPSSFQTATKIDAVVGRCGRARA